MKMGAPVVGLNDSGGARIQEGVLSLGGYADIFLRNTLASGVVPQISAIMGPCAGGAVYSPAITDFTVMVEGTSYMFVTGPDVIRTVTHEEVTKEELGGAMTHNEISGVAHFAVPTTTASACALIRELLVVPARQQRRRAAAPADRPIRADREDEALDRLVPDVAQPALRHARPHARGRRRRATSSRCTSTSRATSSSGSRASAAAASASSPTSRRTSPARSTSTPRSRRRGSCGSATPSTSRWSRSRTCRASCRARAQEYGGIIRHGAKLLYAFAEATVPKLTVITRKAYGGAYCVMSSKHIRTDVNFAWPTAEIAVMGPEGAVNVLYQRELEAAADPVAQRALQGRRVPREVRQPVRRRRRAASSTR